MTGLPPPCIAGAAPRSPHTMLQLAHGLAFADLYSVEGVVRLDERFLAHLEGADPALAERFRAGRAHPSSLAAKAESALLIEVAPHLEDFITDLFGVATAVRALEARHHELAPLFAVKRQFVQRKAMNAYKADVAATFDGNALRAEVDALIGPHDDVQAFELAFAQAVTRWQQDEAANAAALDVAQRYAAWAVHTHDGKLAHRRGVLFRAPRKLDMLHLVPVETVREHGIDALQRAAQRCLGDELPLQGVPIYTDARHYTAAGVPTVLYGAGPRTLAEANGHRADERLRLDDLARATGIVAVALADLLTPAERRSTHAR